VDVYKKSWVLIEFNVNSESDLDLIISQKNKCRMPFKDYNYSNVRFILSKYDKEDKSIHYLHGKSGVEKDLWESCSFDIGYYLLFVEVDWEGNSFPLTISAYGNGHFKFGGDVH